MVEFNTQAEVQEAICKEVIQSSYHLAEEAPICQGKLRDQFGYSATSLAAQQVLNGNYQFEEGFQCRHEEDLRGNSRHQKSCSNRLCGENYDQRDLAEEMEKEERRHFLLGLYSTLWMLHLWCR